MPDWFFTVFTTHLVPLPCSPAVTRAAHSSPALLNEQSWWFTVGWKIFPARWQIQLLSATAWHWYFCVTREAAIPAVGSHQQKSHLLPPWSAHSVALQLVNPWCCSEISPGCTSWVFPAWAWQSCLALQHWESSQQLYETSKLMSLAT